MPSSSNEKHFLVGLHASQLAGVVLPFGSILVPLFIWLLHRETSESIKKQGVEILNFQIPYVAMTILMSACTLALIDPLWTSSIGAMPLFSVFQLVNWVGIFIFSILMPIQAAKAVSRGETFRYPTIFRLL